jgi:photosystem II stability/assembly factor-like uncharacterized protein
VNTIYFGKLLNRALQIARTRDQGETTTLLPLKFGRWDQVSIQVGQNPRVIYAARVNQNSILYRSEDDGATWTNITNGLSLKVSISDFVVDPNNGNTLYVLNHEGSSIFTKIYKSIDAGRNWKKSDRGISDRDILIRSIAIDPHDSNIIYSVGFREMFVSRDAGATWSYFPMTPYDGILDLAMGGTSGSSLFAAGYQGVYRWVEDE